VDAFIHAGDATQGSDRMHLGMEHEVLAHGSDAQVSYVARTYPKSERGAKTLIISGNHDASFLKDGGSNVVRQIVSARPDMVYLGQDAAYLTIGSLRAYVVHPDGGGAYAKSYKGQKFSESLPVDKDVRLLLLGHYHNYVSFMQRETAVFQLPCFQSQYSWLARKGLHPDIGGIILDLWLDDDGRLARVSHEVVRFPALENDWDHEASAEVNRGWSSKGLNL
jgi:predicted phosphodiesterase